MKTLKSLATGLLLSGAVASTQTMAATIDMAYQGSTYGYETVNYTLSGSSSNVYSGMLNFSTSNPQGASPIAWGTSLDTFCVELDQYVTSNSKTYNIVKASDSTRLNATKADLLGRLYTGYRADIDTKTESAAFQLAVWDLVYDTDLDVDSGTFKVNNQSGLRSMANGWLSSLAGIANEFDMFVLEHDSKQDQLVFTPNPPQVAEPALLSLFGLGLMGLGLQARSRRRA